MKNGVTNALPTNYVSLISKDFIHLENVSENVTKAIVEIHASTYELEGRTIWKVPYVNNSELAERLNKLNKFSKSQIEERDG